GCASWYQQDNGKNFTIWPWSTWKYWLETRKINASDYVWVKCENHISSSKKQAATTL
ncbi:MAG TPA: NAD(P)/FAD-dependent oxidoreductase, partial [Agitococcus sp.]|nr:NAD(P)/FAD-dependent oxidoreductase [Agitococcus sp.]